MGLVQIGLLIFFVVAGGDAVGQLVRNQIVKRQPLVLERKRLELPPVVTQTQVSQLLRVAMTLLTKISERSSNIGDPILAPNDLIEIQRLIKDYKEPMIAEHELLKRCMLTLTTLRTKQQDSAPLWAVFETEELKEVDTLLAVFYGTNQRSN